MNAIIALCHFCEAHGPCPILCTHTLRDTKIDELVNNGSGNENACPGCNSIGKTVGLLSQDSESNANFLSTQTTVINDIWPIVKQAAVRSLSCEARGFFRLFSIIVLMKDKMYLLNVQPFLAENLQKISTELQSYSSQIHSAEQAKYSERAQRLNSGHASTQPPRSLIELTGEPNIFAYIHSHFAWILWMGARCLTENINIGLPLLNITTNSKLDPFSVIQLKVKDSNATRKLFNDNDNEHFVRKSQSILGEYFPSACYCALVGIQIVLRGPPSITTECLKCFGKLLPETMHHLICIESDQYLPSSQCRILSVLPHVAVPQPSDKIYRIDFTDDSDEAHIKWPGTLPNKYPDLLTKVLKSVDEKLIPDLVLTKQIRVLVEEWKNKVACLQTISSNADLVKVKKVMGVQPQDQALINYWSSSFLSR
ncbi:folliculin isoform X2 [Sitodiplosis mosellana]|uniref:folliculin isoform X2 n=1 Tax=Sitodiplosis mosellana TaxID=263140 RepID=UPI00244454ED|nr:folliculin isoform X2 [Sitodiplosis mosellana]